MQDECDRAWEIDALREGRLGSKDAESFERHRRTCAICAERVARDERLCRLARALPRDPPSELALRRLRTRVLRDVATGVVPASPSVWPRLAVATAIAAVCAGGWMLAAHRGASVAPVVATASTSPAVLGPAREPFAGSVIASTGSRWTQTREGQTERVRLDDGAIALHVRPQLVGERFLVELPDGTLEVRGTTFQVTVEDGVTRRVHVDEGLVELSLRERPASRLGPGETWPPPALPPAVAPPRDPAPSAGPAPSATGHDIDDGAAAYATAMQELGSGRNDEAARAFHEFAVAHPRAPQAEDASFLEAVALARAGRQDAAAVVAERHLGTFPRSFHRREASILVARAASNRGDCDKARAALAPWLGSSADAEVAAALRPCDTAGAH
ncbi:MAG TPA: FecR domain-containing protein [Polyangiaceae bacterium]